MVLRTSGRQSTGEFSKMFFKALKAEDLKMGSYLPSVYFNKRLIVFSKYGDKGNVSGRCSSPSIWKLIFFPKKTNKKSKIT